MKRLHVSVAVEDLAQSVRFYSTLFGAEPSVLKPDYAKWMMEDPRVNFSISSRVDLSRGDAVGLDHLGIQVESREELAEIADRLANAGRAVFDKGEAHCCYAHSHKAWVRDPQGLAWETFFTFGSSTTYGEDSASEGEPAKARSQTCCEPAAGCCAGDAA
jgi:catechol 2,3-dioxygenase-like lactoylglutathione lyase family enzyme